MKTLLYILALLVIGSGLYFVWNVATKELPTSEERAQEEIKDVPQDQETPETIQDCQEGTNCKG